MHYFIILHFFYFFCETLRSLCTSFSCHVDNIGVCNSILAHGVYNIDLCVTPLQDYPLIIAHTLMLNGGQPISGGHVLSCMPYHDVDYKAF